MNLKKNKMKQRENKKHKENEKNISKLCENFEQPILYVI